jgi:thiol-disulfide isomerase/thioredoxin
MLALCVALAGCSGSGKKTAMPKAAKDDRPARDDGPPLTKTGATADSGGTIGGKVIDLFDNTPPADIWIIPPGDGQGAPVVQHAETDRNGWFTVHNLRPGQPYRVVAVTRDGQFKQAAEATVRPPKTHFVLQVSQDCHPNIPGGGEGGLRATPGQPLPITPGGAPDRGSGSGVYMKDPIPLPDVSPGTGSVTPIRPDHFTDRTDPSRGRESPRVIIPGPPGTRPVPAPPKPPTPPAPSGGSGGPPLPEPPLSPVGVTPVPSCDLRGNQLFNLALPGLDGEPWEYKRNRRPGTKLVLIDFWGTWCSWCRVSIKKHVVPLNDLYGRQGLEVIGVAYEQEPTFAAQVRTVEVARRQLGINYRILMGAGMKTCPVARDFGIEAFPTLVLVDDKGQIIWEKRGAPTESDFEYLKAEIRKGLGIR